MASQRLRAAVGVVVVCVVVGVVAAVLAVLGSRNDDTGNRTEDSAGTARTSAGPSGALGSEQSPAADPGALLTPQTATATPSGSVTPLPGLRKATRRLQVDAPRRAATAAGTLVRGYPSSVVPVPTGAVIRSSSIARQGSRVQSTLVGTYSGPRSSLLAGYRRTLRSRGLLGATVPAVAGSRAVTFSDGVNAVTLTTSRGQRHLRFSVVSLLRAKS